MVGEIRDAETTQIEAVFKQNPDLSLNLLTSMAGSGPLEPEGADYAPLLRRLRPFLDALARERAGRLRCGVDVTDDERYAWRAPV